MRANKIILALVSIIILSSCIKERSLRYDASLLEPEVQNAELMIAYQVPAGYKMLSQSFTDSIARAELAANPFSEKRIAIYLDTLITSTDRRLLKYYFYENDKAQFSIDYYFRNSYYNDLKPYIESSLASVKKNHEIIIELLDQ